MPILLLILFVICCILFIYFRVPTLLSDTILEIVRENNSTRLAIARERTEQITIQQETFSTLFDSITVWVFLLCITFLIWQSRHILIPYLLFTIERNRFEKYTGQRYISLAGFDTFGHKWHTIEKQAKQIEYNHNKHSWKIENKYGDIQLIEAKDT